MTIEELKERLSAIDDELTAIMAELDEPEEEPSEEEPTEESRASTEELEARSAKLMEERQGIMAEIEKAEKALEEEKRAMTEVIENKDTEIIEKKEEDKTMADMEIRNTEAYINAYAEYLKTGEDAECRSLLTENGSGTVPIPELVYDITKTAWEREGITARVRKAYIKGNLKVGFELSATGATVHTEGSGAVTEETLVLGTVTLVPKSIKKWIGKVA